jgi:hypothetical protein
MRVKVLLTNDLRGKFWITSPADDQFRYKLGALDIIATHIWQGPSKYVDTDKVRLIGFHDLAPDRVESAAIKTLALFPVRALDFRLGSNFHIRLLWDYRICDIDRMSWKGSKPPFAALHLDAR